MGDRGWGSEGKRRKKRKVAMGGGPIYLNVSNVAGSTPSPDPETG
jgi:hypothetical protein